MKKNKVIRYAANTALLAVIAAAGIGVYQFGTSIPEENTQEVPPSYYDESIDAKMEQSVGTGTELLETETGEIEITTDNTGVETETVSEEIIAEISDENEVQISETEENDSDLITESVSASADVQMTSKLSFSEDTLMEWPVDGNILLDYNMDQTIYHATLDQYKLSPAIAVQAVEGAPVLASVSGTVYSIEENAQTGTTITMEIGSGYQAIYGQLKDITIQEGETVAEGTIIGYVDAPTKYYSKEGSNLYFALKKDGEPIDPIAYLP